MSRVRLISLNLQHGVSAGGEPTSADGLAAALAPLGTWGPDVVVLQEVDRFQPRSGRLDQAAVVGQALGLPHRRYAAVLAGDVRAVRARPSGRGVALSGGAAPLGEDVASYGVAVLSRYPVLAAFADPLPGVGRWPARRGGRWRVVADEPRGLLACVLDVAGTDLTVATMHASLHPAVALRQTERAARRIAELGDARVLAGDLNLGPLATRAATAGGLRALTRGATFPSRAPGRAIDHALGAGLGLPEGCGGPLDRLAVSDHLPLGVVIEVPADRVGGLRGPS